jgi:hypothetical protein
MEVYRLEHPHTKEGPFRDSNYFDGKITGSQRKVLDELCDWANCDETAPSIYEDILDEDGDLIDGINYPCVMEDIYSACPNLEVLTSWFGYYLNDLFEMGFRLYKLKLKEGSFVAGRSGLQVGFVQYGIIDKQEINYNQYGKVQDQRN